MAEYGGNPEAEKQPGKIYTNQKIDNCNFFGVGISVSSML